MPLKKPKKNRYDFYVQLDEEYHDFFHNTKPKGSKGKPWTNKKYIQHILSSHAKTVLGKEIKCEEITLENT